MRHMLRSTWWVCCFLLCPALASAQAQEQSLPAEVLQVLRHRIGQWDIRNDVLGPDGSVARVSTERHEVRFVINDQIVETHGFIEGHEDFRSFLLFNPALGKYMQITIDRSNNHVDLLADRETPYRFTSNPFVAPNGASVLFRQVFTTVEPDRVVGYGEISADGGTTWRRVYNQYRTRRH